MTAVFRADGTWPVWREQFMILVIIWLMAEEWVFIKAEGNGSGAQVEGFIFLMISSTSRCVMSMKQQRGWAIPGWGLTVGIGVAEGVERRARMLSTFVLKKEMNLLHCSCVVSNFRGVWGLRRLLTVEKCLLEFPGFLMFPIGKFVHCETWNLEVPFKDTSCFLHFPQLAGVPGGWMSEGNCSGFDRGMEVQEAAQWCIIEIHRVSDCLKINRSEML